jgi:hypothetical protein
MDDLTKWGPADANRINVHEAYELAYWTRALAVSEAELRKAVAEAGVMVANVSAYLGSRRKR